MLVGCLYCSNHCLPCSWNKKNMTSRAGAMRRGGGPGPGQVMTRRTRGNGLPTRSTRLGGNGAAFTTRGSTEVERPPPALQGQVEPFQPAPPDNGELPNGYSQGSFGGYHPAMGNSQNPAMMGNSQNQFATNARPDMVAAVRTHNHQRGLLLSDKDVKQRCVAFVNNKLFFKIPFPDYQHLSSSDREGALREVQTDLGLRESEFSVRRKSIEGHVSNGFKHRRTDANTNCKKSYMGKYLLCCGHSPCLFVAFSWWRSQPVLLPRPICRPDSGRQPPCPGAQTVQLPGHRYQIRWAQL